MISINLWQFVRCIFQFITYFFILNVNAQQLSILDLNSQNYVFNNPAIWEPASFLNNVTDKLGVDNPTHTDFQITGRSSFEHLQNLQTALGLFHHIQNKNKDDDKNMFIRLGLMMMHEKSSPLVINRPLMHGSTILFLNEKRNSFIGIGANLGFVFANLNGDLNPYHLGDPLLNFNQTRFNTQAKLDAGVFFQHYFLINGTDVHPFIGIAVQNVARQTTFQNIENYSLPMAKHWVINAGFIYNLTTKPSSQYLELNFLGKSASSTPLFTNSAIKYHNYWKDWKIVQVFGLGVTARPKLETAYLSLEGSPAPNCKMGLLTFFPLNRPVAQLFGCGLEATFRYTLVYK